MGRLVNPAANLGNRHQHGVACDGVIGGLYAADAGGRHHAGLRVCPKTLGGITEFSEHEAD
jgi:hypothetical protein